MSVIGDIRKVLDAQLETLGITHSLTPPSTVNPPMSVISLDVGNPITYHETGGVNGTTTVKFIVTLLLGLQEIEMGVGALDDYLMPQDDKSVKLTLEAIDGQLLSDGVTRLDWVAVKGVSNYGVAKWGNNQNYLAADFQVEVMVSGE